MNWLNIRKHFLGDWLICISIVMLLFLALTYWTWLKWPDILIDFGRELYIPWQLSVGKVLYKDIAYFHGPLSPYLNAIWFRIFGVSLKTLIFCNLALLAILTSIIFMLTKKSCDSVTATLSCMVFLCSSAFAQFIKMGSFNFVCPYDHSLTHGVILSYIMLWFLSCYIQRARIFVVIFVGVLLGMIFLTKAEVFVPAIISATFGIILSLRINKTNRFYNYSVFPVILISMLIPCALAFLYLANQMSIIDALQGLFGDWAILYKSNISQLAFYKEKSGIDDPIKNITAMFLICILITFIILYIVKKDIAKGSLIKTRSQNTYYLCYSIFTIIIVTYILNISGIHDIFAIVSIYIIQLIGRPLPLLSLFCGLFSFYLLLSNFDNIIIKKMAIIVVHSILSLLLLGKLFINSHISDYGFCLAMPAMITMVILFVWLLPEILKKYYNSGLLFRRIAVYSVVAFIFCTFPLSNYFYSKKDYLIGKGSDRFLTYGSKFEPGGEAISILIKHINHTMSQSNNFIVIPEGIMINYLVRKSTSIKYISITPGEVAVYGETAILNSLRNCAPDYIIKIPRKTDEFRVRPFGEDSSYGKQIMDWVNIHYMYVWQLIEKPISGNFLVELLVKK
jgi:hypothetical protein